MRVGGLGPTDCLAPGSMFVPNNFFVNNTKNNIILSPQSTAVSIIVGTGIGGMVLGLAIGVLAYICFVRVRRRRQRSPSQNYFASQHFSSTKPYKAPSIVPSTIAPSSAPQRTYQHFPPSTQNPEPPMPNSLGFNRSFSYTPSLPTISDSTTLSNHPSRTVRDLPVPLEPLRSNREPRSHLSLSGPSVIASSDSGSVTEQNHFPLDVKARLQPFSTSDDAASVASSTSYARSNLARAPTYASTSASTSARHPRGVYVIDENEVTDVPPEYGRHTDDTSCTPSIISSGLGRIPSSYISSGRF